MAWTIPAPPPPDEVSLRQFARAASSPGHAWITEAEALAWAGGDALPAIAVAIIGALPSSAQFGATLDALGATRVERLDPLILAAQAALGATDAQRDDLFRLAASL